MNPKNVMTKNGKKPKISIGWRKELHMKEEPTIVEDEISRTREVRKFMKKRYESLIELKAPQILIDDAKSKLNITYAEYLLLEKQYQEDDKAYKTQYAKDNPHQKEIVDEIYSRMEKLPYSYNTVLIHSLFDMEIDPISFMGQAHYWNELYEPILRHAQHLYYEKYKKEFHEEQKRLCGDA